MTSDKRPDLSKDAPVEVNEAGGRGTDTGCHLHYVPNAMLALGGVFAYGAKKHGTMNWKKVTGPEHINHALVHLQAQLSGDIQDDHLAHAACRIMMALELWEEQGNVPAYIIDESKLFEGLCDNPEANKIQPGRIIRIPPGTKHEDVAGLVARAEQEILEETVEEKSCGPNLCCSKCLKVDFLHGDTLKKICSSGTATVKPQHFWLCQNCYANFDPEKQDSS